MRSFLLLFCLTFSISSQAATSIGRLEVSIGDKMSSFELFADQTFKSQRGQEPVQSGKLNNRNYKYFSREFTKANKLKSFPVQGCLTEKVKLEIAGKKIESCIGAKNSTAKGLTELANRVRFLM